MDDEPTILQVIDRIGAWAVLIASEWSCDWSNSTKKSPVETAQDIIAGDVEIPVEYEAKETWEDEIE